VGFILFFFDGLNPDCSFSISLVSSPLTRELLPKTKEHMACL